MNNTAITHMLENQREMQENVYGDGTPTHKLPDLERMDYIRTQVLALENELHEFLGETGWKPWAKSNHINAEACKGELVDAWHFFMNLMNHVEMTSEDLVNGYWTKQKKNRDRQTAGYDGRAEKCPICKRALDDEAVMCTVTKFEERSELVVRCFA